MRLLIALVALLACSPAFAVLGRLANVESQPDISTEGEIEFGDNGYMGIYLAGTYKFTPDLLGTGRFVLADTDGGDYNQFGFEALYQVHDLLETVDTAVVFSYDRLDYDVNNASGSNLIVRGVVSGRNGLGGNGNIYPYGNLIFARASVKVGGRSNSDTEIGFGGGVVIPTATGEFFGGIDIIDDPFFGAGFRYFLQ